MSTEHISDNAFSGDTIVVTGAARGIGAACAQVFTRTGGTVIGADIRDLDETAQTCENNSGEFIPVVTDVTDPTAVEELLAVARDHGKADILVNVAGIITRGSVGETDVSDWQHTLDVNLSGPFLVVKEGVEQLRETGGAVVNVSSIYGQIGTKERTAYCSSKAGVDGLTRALAADLGADGIRVNAVAPGFIRTPMTEPYFDDDEVVTRFEDLTALGRLGTATDVADVVVFLASDGARYISGETVLVDGGRGTVE